MWSRSVTIIRHYKRKQVRIKADQDKSRSSPLGERIYKSYCKTLHPIRSRSRSFPRSEVGGIESSVYSTPPDDHGGAVAVSGAPCWDGEAENRLPTPCTDSDAHFRRAARGVARRARTREGHVSGSGGPRRRRCCQVEGRAGTLRHGNSPQPLD